MDSAFCGESALRYNLPHWIRRRRSLVDGRSDNYGAVGDQNTQLMGSRTRLTNEVTNTTKQLGWGDREADDNSVNSSLAEGSTSSSSTVFQSMKVFVLFYTTVLYGRKSSDGMKESIFF